MNLLNTIAMSRGSGYWNSLGEGVKAATIGLLCTGLLGGGSLAQQPQLQIVTPVDGTVVAPGQTISVVAVAGRGVNFTNVFIIGQKPIGFSDTRTAPPFQFNVTIPEKIQPGRYLLTASGVTTPGRGAESDPISIVVEKVGSAANLSAAPNKIVFSYLGERIPITVTGMFSDGSTVDISRSSRTSYTSADASIATVDANGLVASVSTGGTEITVHYGTQVVMVPISVVTGPAVTVSATPTTLWPPDGAIVPVVISGTITDGGGGIRADSARYAVTDLYGLIQPTGKIGVARTGPTL